MSTRFLRPGERQSSAFGVTFDIDRDATQAIPPLFNRYQHLRVEDQKRLLPIFKHEKEILFLVERHATSIVVGETGSGKTTQIPQYLYHAGWAPEGFMIACTQPRRVAAISVAARVAEEMRVGLGDEVGYAIRFEDVSSDKTRIRFCTDGVLLREMTEDPLLTKYSVVMVDEAHERSVTTDILLGLLKKIQRRRPDLRVIISSATIQAETFAGFFMDSSRAIDEKDATADSPTGYPGLISVQGRMHSVQVSYLEEPCDDYLKKAVETVYAINQRNMPGDILVFLTGQEECEKAVGWIEEDGRNQSLGRDTLQLKPVALYAGLPGKYQIAVFEAPPRNHRKVVFATNIAETSVTIDGIVHVIDCMFSKQRSFNPFTGIESLLVSPISKASALQRSGRAGRVRPGFAYRLCTQDAFEGLRSTDRPEMQRCDLIGIVLQLKGLGVDNILNFPWLAPPSSEALVRSLESLHALGALGNDAKLTPYWGTYMAEFPLQPSLSKCLLMAWSNGCALEVATIVAVLSVQSIWVPRDKKSMDLAKLQFAVGEGDLITYLNVWKAWEDSGRSKAWAIKNLVSHRCLLRASDIRDQIMKQLVRIKRQTSADDPVFGGKKVQDLRESMLFGNASMFIEERQENIKIISKTLLSGLFLNAAEICDENSTDGGVNGPNYRLLRSFGESQNETRLRIHPSSVMFRCRPKYLCFFASQQVDAHLVDMQEVHIIEPEWLHEIAPHFFETIKKHSV